MLGNIPFNQLLCKMNAFKILKISFNKNLRAFSLVLYRNFTKEVTAGVLIIGDEILNGQTQDANSHFLIQNLNNMGVKINQLSILPDDVEAIAREVALLSERCTVVLTSGGIGPTHDDVTYEAVAKACGEGLESNPELIKIFKDYFGSKADEIPAVAKFSSIPVSAKLNYGIDKSGEKTKFPLVSTKNIYMLPGVPMLLQKGFEVFRNNFLLYNKPRRMRNIFVSLDEFSVTPVLNEAVQIFDKRVKFGSYPSFTENYFKVKLVLESSDEKWIQEAFSFFNDKLPAGCIVNLKENVLKNAIEDMEVLSESFPILKKALTVTESALAQYSLNEICLCFNGGKDCTALLHILHSCCTKLAANPQHSITTLYVKGEDTFPEMDDFVTSTSKRYNLNLISLQGDLKSAFRTFLNIHPHVKAVFMGTRSGDPGALGLTHFAPTDPSWPEAMRVLPLVDWSYSDVWHFLRNLQLPYCVLYDRGYTSIGLKSQTRPNALLLVQGQKGFRSYKPAYMLTDIQHERNGRM